VERVELLNEAERFVCEWSLEDVDDDDGKDCCAKNIVIKTSW